MFRGMMQFVAIALLGFINIGCACTGPLRAHSKLWDGPAGWASAGADYFRNKTVVIPDRYPSAYAVNGVHHVRNMEKIMLRGVVLVADSSGATVLAPLVCDNGRLVADTGFDLGVRVEKDEYGNYAVTPRQDLGGYPRVLVPAFAVGRVLGPTFVFTENAWDTRTFLWTVSNPYTGQTPTRIATWLTPACSGRMVLLPAGESEGYDFRWEYSGGANPATLVPDVGAGVTIAVNGFPVLLEKKLVVSRGKACQVFRPSM